MPTASSYSTSDLVRLRSHYDSLKDKASYDAFIRYGHDLLKRISADPYHVRMALIKGYSMMEFGNRAAFQHREKDGQVEIGLLIRMADLNKVEERYKLFEHNFKPAGGMSFIHPLVERWETLPPLLLELHEAAMREEYKRIKDTTLVDQRRGSGTDNKALEYAVVHGVLINDLPEPEPEQRPHKTSDRMDIPLNRIFYGPPGTGKTYHTIGAAVQVCDPEFHAANQGDDAALRKRFNELLIKDWQGAEGRIAFCTFHQSYSYEDFVEGIKPLKPKEGETYLKYDIRPGVLKQIAQWASPHAHGQRRSERARLRLSATEFKNAQFFKLSLGDTQNKEDDDIYRACIERNVIAIGFMEQHDLTGKSEEEIASLPLRPEQAPSSADQMKYFSRSMKVGDYVVVTNGNYSARAVGKVVGDYRYDPEKQVRYPHVRDVQWLIRDQDIPFDQIYYTQFTQRTIYKLYKDKLNLEFFGTADKPTSEDGTPERFVLIIDEINRGNVAGIFGELITLIEENKRKGRPEALEVTLPYSQEPFSIPDNLYIIGTMNTADRSVEALDAALRRRFSFVPMMPDTSELKPLQNPRIDLGSLLDKLNARLVQLLDEDHQIGHSHFWELHKEADPLPALRRVFKDKIIPQLEEYFHRDRAKLRLVLGEQFVERLEPDDDVFLGDADDLSVESRPTYRITAADTWDENAFVSIHG